jgi:Zn-dependent membrane protease YugP
MLADHGISDVKITHVEGQLTDHYNPANKTVNLSESVYSQRNAAAAAVAAHECGHAVQHAEAYAMLGLRSRLVPMVQISSTIMNYANMIMLFAGGFLFYKGNPMGTTVLIVLIAANIFLTLFAMITLPVEFDASNRALVWLESSGVSTRQEHDNAKDALWWAAMTYVVAAIASIATLLYYIMIYMGGRRD